MTFNQGIIALDIDGTLTSSRNEKIPPPVLMLLKQLHDEGWKILFVTGRTFSWAYPLLSDLEWDFRIAVQNGSLSLAMPSKKILRRKYLSIDLVEQLTIILHNAPNEFVVYAGMDHQEKCYWRSFRFNEQMRKHLEARRKALEENWVDVSDFNALNEKDFASVRIFGEIQQMQQVSSILEKELNVSAPMMIDSYDNRYRIVQVTHKEASKGDALAHYRQEIGGGICIAAGDDHNDISMFHVAQIGIAMADAPPELLQLAKICAPSVKQMGIITALKQAVELAKIEGVCS